MHEVDVAVKRRALLGECPRWDERENLLYWVDIDAMQLHRFDPASGASSVRQLDEPIGSFVLKKAGGFVIATASGFHFLDGFDAEPRAIADPEATISTNRFNDGRCDPAGRYFCGTVYTPKDKGGANLYSLDTRLHVRHLESNIITSNGIAFSRDNRWMYFSDTPRHVLYRYRYDLGSGDIYDRQVFHRFPHGEGRPDGGSLDSEGCYWTALFEGGRVVRLDPDGRIMQEIAVPSRCPTMAAFGGPDLKTLFVTSAGNRPDAELQAFPDSGGVFSVTLDVAGLVEHRFGD